MAEVRKSRRGGRRHWVFAGVLLATLGAWGANVFFGVVRTGGRWAIAYGAAALALLVLASGYGLRRRAMRLASRDWFGRADSWLAVHVYGSLLFLLLVLMHSGFRWPSGWVTWWLWGLSWWVVVGGLGGLLLQRWLPRLLTSGLTVEAHYDRIPELVDGLRVRAEKLAAQSAPEVADLYTRVVAPSLVAPQRRWRYFLDITGGVRNRLREFRYLGRFLPPEERRQLEELETILQTKLELDAHYSLQQPLRWWLYLHLPPAALLLVFVALHLWAVFLY